MSQQTQTAAEAAPSESTITRAIIGRFAEKLLDHITVDVAIVGAGPSALVAAHDLAEADVLRHSLDETSRDVLERDD